MTHRFDGGRIQPAREIPADFESASLTTRTRRLDATPGISIPLKLTVLFFSSFLSSSVDHFRLSPSSCLNHSPLHYVRRLASISFLSILPHRAHPFVPLFRTTHIHSMHVFLIHALIMMPVYVVNTKVRCDAHVARNCFYTMHYITYILLSDVMIPGFHRRSNITCFFFVLYCPSCTTIFKWNARRNQRRTK